MAPTKIKRAAALDVQTEFEDFLREKLQVGVLTKRFEARKKRLKDFLIKGASSDVYESETGSKFFDLSKPIALMGKVFIGMEARRTVRTVFDEEAAEKILKRKGVYEEALTPVLDQDKIYRLQQEGKISAKDVDNMFSESEQFAFWPVEGDPE